MKHAKKNVGRPSKPPVCDGDCFNCKFDDCIITDKELVRQMREPKKGKKKIYKIGKLKGEFKAEYILTPLPGSPEVERTWEEAYEIDES